MGEGRGRRRGRAAARTTWSRAQDRRAPAPRRTPSWRPRPVRARRARAASRVLPIPASPRTTTTPERHRHERRQLGVAADDRRRPGTRRWRRRVRCAPVLAVARVSADGASPSCDSQTLGEPVVHRERRRAGRRWRPGAALREVARRRLVERIELEAPPRVPDGERRASAAACASRARIAPSRAVCAVARSSSTQSWSRSASSGPRCSAAAASSASGRQGARAPGDRSCRSAARRAPCRRRAHQSRPPDRARGAAPRRRSAATPGARVQHVGPEARGQRAARMLAGCSASHASSSTRGCSRAARRCGLRRRPPAAEGSRTRSMRRSYAGATFMRH